MRVDVTRNRIMSINNKRVRAFVLCFCCCRTNAFVVVVDDDDENDDAMHGH